MRHRPLTVAAICWSVIAACSTAQVIPTFAPRDALVPAGFDRPLVAGDFDGDGDLDLIDVAGATAFNDGDGRFSPGGQVGGGTLVPFGPGTIPLVAGTGDLDGDGDLDLLSPAVFGPGLWTWLNDGTGTLTAAVRVTITVPGDTVDVATGDIDGDGDIDFVTTTSFTPPSPSVYLNDGTGGFTIAPSPFPYVVNANRYVELFDVDNDGDLDVLLSRTTPAPFTLLFLNDGFGGFSSTPAAPGDAFQGPQLDVADFDGDGLLDVLTTTTPPSSTPAGLTVWFNQGGAAFAGTPSLMISETAAPLALDLDADGSAEIAFPTVDVGVTIHDVLATGVQPASATLAAAAATALACDVDGDGDDDALFGSLNAPRRIATALNDGVGNLTLVDRSIHGSPTGEALHGDVDGDGDLDLLTLETTEVRVFQNDGRGRLTWTPGTGSIPPLASIPARTLFDPDGDGDLDVYVGSAVSRLLVQQPGSWASVILPTPGISTAASLVAAADMDGDQKDDIVRVPSGPGPTTVLIGGAAVTTVTLPQTAITQDIALVDVDADGDLDIIQANVISGLSSTPTQLWLNNGTASNFTLDPTFPTVSARHVAAADLNLDGLVDVVFDDRVFLRIGAAWSSPIVLQQAIPGAVPGQTGDLSLVDVNADGTPDLLDGNGQWWPNLGTAIGAPVLLPAAAADPLPHGDFDRDGDIDLLLGDVLFQNLTRQLSRPAPARLGRFASLELDGEPGVPWSLWAASGPGDLTLPEGLVQIDPTTAIPVTTGVLDLATGRDAFVVGIPNNPGLLGLTLHWQALIFESGQPRLTTARATPVRTF